MRITVSVHFIRYIYTEEDFIKIQMGVNYSGGPSYAKIVNVSWDKCIHVQSALVFFHCLVLQSCPLDACVCIVYICVNVPVCVCVCMYTMHAMHVYACVFVCICMHLLALDCRMVLQLQKLWKFDTIRYSHFIYKVNAHKNGCIHHHPVLAPHPGWHVPLIKVQIHMYTQVEDWLHVTCSTKWRIEHSELSCINSICDIDHTLTVLHTTALFDNISVCMFTSGFISNRRRQHILPLYCNAYIEARSCTDRLCTVYDCMYVLYVLYNLCTHTIYDNIYYLCMCCLWPLLMISS